MRPSRSVPVQSGGCAAFEYTLDPTRTCIIPGPSFPCSRWLCPLFYICMEPLTSDVFNWVLYSGTGQKYIHVHVYLYTYNAKYIHVCTCIVCACTVHVLLFLDILHLKTHLIFTLPHSPPHPPHPHPPHLYTYVYALITVDMWS